jgi:HEAT repeat protein
MLDQESLSWLIKQSQDGDPVVRSHAVAWMGIFKDARLVEPLLAAFCDTDVHVRESVILALVGMDDERVLEVLRAALCDDYPSVRRMAAAALEQQQAIH